MKSNQAVLFTKPLHHLAIDLLPEELQQRTITHFEEAGFSVVFQKQVSGPELACRDVIRQHYRIYSEAACAKSLSVSEAAKQRFEDRFKRSWDAEAAAGRILPTDQLLQSRGIDSCRLFEFWNRESSAHRTEKLEDGFVMAWIAEMDAYCVNAFYLSMEENLYHEDTRIGYFVMEFDPRQTSWEDFRKKVLGSTNASAADPDSLRGRLYAEFPIKYPGRDNFVHGSAGPLEGLIERSIHEEDLQLETNPVGAALAERGISLLMLNRWRTAQPVSVLSKWFDRTEERDTDVVTLLLEEMDFYNAILNHAKKDNGREAATKEPNHGRLRAHGI